MNSQTPIGFLWLEAQVSSLRYFPYGSTRSSSGALGTDRKFTSQRLDLSGLYYYGARYYDPQVGRFVSPDTIVPDPANPQALNRYTYVYNNPLKYTDPSGHLGFFAAIGLGALIGAVVNTVAYVVRTAVDQNIGFTKGGLAKAAASGAVAGALAASPLKFLAGTGWAGVAASIGVGGIAGAEGYLAGEGAESLVSKVTGAPDQSSPNIGDMLIAGGTGMAGSGVGQVATALNAARMALGQGMLSDATQAFKSSISTIVDVPAEPFVVSAFVAAGTSVAIQLATDPLAGSTASGGYGHLVEDLMF
ncbi:MAG: RHS repeat-associated core domain-containing protein [Chloroflexota bacterium]